MSAGLFVLQSEVAVTVTREEFHQQILGRYPVGGASRQVTAELVWCTVASGKYRGQRAVEVKLDGQRVGELTYAMSQRYGAMLDLVNERGYRAGCAAVLFLGKRGVEVELRLPRETSEIVFPVVRPVAAGAVPGKANMRKPAWIAAGVVGAFLVIGIIGSQGDSSPTSSSSGPVADITTTTTTTSSSTPTSSVVVAPPAPPITTTTSVETNVAPPNVNVPPPKTPKTTPKPPPPPKDTPAPPAPPASKCDPNYSGCVPIAADVDCKPGSGNGPAYVRGPVQVIGSDIYGLDADNDGVGCE